MKHFKTIATALIFLISFNLSAQSNINEALAIIDAKISELQTIRDLLAAKCASQDSLEAENAKLITINNNYQKYVEKQNYIFVNNHHASISQIADKRAETKHSHDEYVRRWVDCVNAKGTECGCQDLKDNSERMSGRLDILDALINGNYLIEQKAN